MKNKTFIKVISLMLMLILCIGTVACANGGAGDDTSDDTSSETTAASTEAPGGSGSDNNDNNDDDNKKPAVNTEEALFEELRKAYEASLAYSGALTAIGVQTSEIKQGEETSTNESSMKMSVDVDNGKYFMTDDSEYDYTSYSSVTKIFSEGGAVYEYEHYEYLSTDPEKEEALDSVEDTYTKRTSIDDFMTEQIEGLATVVESFAGGLFLAESYAEATSAFSEAYNKIKTNEINYMKSEGLLEEGATITLSPVIAIGKDAATGETVITITSHLNVSKMVEYETEMDNYDVTTERKFACKDGKITSLLMSVSVSTNYVIPNEEGEEETMSLSTKIVGSYGFEYGFDQAGYDAIAVDLPDDPSEIEEEDEDATEITVHLGDAIALDCELYESATAQEAFNEIIDEIKYEFGWEHNGDEEVAYVTVKDFYKDAALTQKIDFENISYDELVALGDIYADYEIMDGYALVNEKYEEKQELSKKFQIAGATMISYGYESPYGRIVAIDEAYELDTETDRNIERKIYVNGTLTTADSLTLESGKTYEIKYVDIINDNNVGISYVIQAGI